MNENHPHRNSLPLQLMKQTSSSSNQDLHGTDTQHRVTGIRENTSKTQIQKNPSIGLKAPHTTSSISKQHKDSISIGLKAPHNNLTYFKTAYRFVICSKSCKMLFLKFSSKVLNIQVRPNLECSRLNLNMNLRWDF